MFWLGNSEKPQKQVRMANMTIFRNIVFCWLPVSQTRFSQSRLAMVVMVKSFLWGVNEIDCRKAVSHPAPGQIVNFRWRIREGGRAPPLFLDQTEARRAKKKFLGDPPPPLSNGLDDRCLKVLVISFIRIRYVQIFHITKWLTYGQTIFSSIFAVTSMYI